MAITSMNRPYLALMFSSCVFTLLFLAAITTTNASPVPSPHRGYGGWGGYGGRGGGGYYGGGQSGYGGSSGGGGYYQPQPQPVYQGGNYFESNRGSGGGQLKGQFSLEGGFGFAQEIAKGFNQFIKVGGRRR